MSEEDEKMPFGNKLGRISGPEIGKIEMREKECASKFKRCDSYSMSSDATTILATSFRFRCLLLLAFCKCLEPILSTIEAKLDFCCFFNAYLFGLSTFGNKRDFLRSKVSHTLEEELKRSPKSN